MGYRIVSVTIVMVFIGAFAIAQAPDLKSMDVVERSVPAGPVALVNGVPIEGADFILEYKRNLKGVAQMVNKPDLDEEFRVRAGLTVLGDMIRHEILLQEAKKRNITVPDAEVEEAYQKKLTHFEEMLTKEMGKQPTEEQVLERAGQTKEEAKTSLRNQFLVERVAEAIAKEKGAKVADSEVREYYEKNPQLFEQPGMMHFSQILIVPKPNAKKADEGAWKKAEETAGKARARILAGEQFAAVAKSASEAPDAAKGGDLGMLPVSELPPFFVEVGKGMKPGDISGVFRSEFGVHVIKLEGTEAAETVSFEKAEPVIKRMLYRIKMDDIVLDFCEPIVNDSEKTKIFIQLDRVLAAQEKEAPKK